jgi:hypothetical protein
VARVPPIADPADEDQADHHPEALRREQEPGGGRALPARLLVVERQWAREPEVRDERNSTTSNSLDHQAS